MIEPVKIAFGQYMKRFYGGVTPSNQFVSEFAQRGLAKSIVFAPSRMIDAAEQMLLAWHGNQTDGKTGTHPPKMPVMIVAFDRDYTPTGRDYTRQVADSEWVSLPEDNKRRAFKIKTIAGDLRVQIVIFAHEVNTAKSLAAQFFLFVDSVESRRFNAYYSFADIPEPLKWPVQLESPEGLAVHIDTGAKNITALAIDITLKCTFPILSAPKKGEAHDGRGVIESNSPPGFAVVQSIQSIHHTHLNHVEHDVIARRCVTARGIQSKRPKA